MTIDIAYGMVCDENGVTTYCFEVNGEVVDLFCDIYGQETYNPLLAIDYKKDGEWYDIMSGDTISISVLMN